MRTSSAIDLLEKLIAEASTLRDTERERVRFNTWKRETEVVLKRLFGSSSDHLKEFGRINFSPVVTIAGAWSDAQEAAYFRKGVSEAMEFLRVLKDEVRRDSRFGSYSASRRAGSFPGEDKITLGWLVSHLPARFALYFLGLLAGVFAIGIRAGQIPWLRDLFRP